jgi:hypothetical protein
MYLQKHNFREVKAGSAIARDSLKGIKCQFVTSGPPE